MPKASATQVRRQVPVGGVSKAELLRLLTGAHVRLNEAGYQLFSDERFQTLELSAMIESVQTSVEGLGLSGGATFTDIVDAAASAGLSPCPLGLGPRLRLTLLDQPEGSRGMPQTKHRAPPGSITVASPPLSEDDETPKGFYLRRIDGTLWLRGYTSWSGHLWAPTDMFVFARIPNAA